MNIVETILNFLYVYMAAIDGRPSLRAVSPLVGLSVALMTFWKTVLYWLQVSLFLFLKSQIPIDIDPPQISPNILIIT